jgi:hypothetical protein
MWLFTPDLDDFDVGGGTILFKWLRLLSEKNYTD